MLESRIFSEDSVDTCSIYPCHLVACRLTPEMITIHKYTQSPWSYCCSVLLEIKISNSRLNKYTIFSSFMQNIPKLETTQMSTNG